MISHDFDQNPAIQKVLERLIAVYEPRLVYLYGSRVWGSPDSASDFDFFVVIGPTDLDQAERIRLGVRALLGTGIDVDLLVFTENEVANRASHPSTLVHRVLTKGLKLYEAA